jgi:hypothetical protein
LLIIFFFEYL